MYKITLEQKELYNDVPLNNRIVMDGLNREDAVGIMFDIVGHLHGAIKLEMDDETKEEAPADGHQ